MLVVLARLLATGACDTPGGQPKIEFTPIGAKRPTAPGLVSGPGGEPGRRTCVGGSECYAAACGTPARTPSSASRAAPPSSAVSTHGPSSVTATVCSQCAAQVPSVVTTVQRSSSSRV